MPHLGSYTHEKLHRASMCLASANGDLRQRLKVAGIDVLIAPANGFECQHQVEELQDLQKALTRIDRADDQGALYNTIDEMTDDELCNRADSIVSLYGDICRQLGN